MKLIKNINTIKAYVKKIHFQGKTIGFVPTMGYLHEGHLSLAKAARKDCDVVVMSIYVNPTQFSPKEDFKKYPRDLNRDKKLAKSVGVDIILTPNDKEMYPQGYLTYVHAIKITNVLCGASRPEHFHGVTTIVAKLFNIVQPDIAYFGQKDAQQAIIIKQMVKDLNFPLKIKVMPIIREKDGLAMSSRNKYLNPKEREDALVLYQSLKFAKSLIKQGQENVKIIKSKMKSLISTKQTAKIDYIAIVDADDLTDVKRIRKNTLLALAVWIGKTRLIDNLIIN